MMVAQSKCRICGHSGEYSDFGKPVQDAYPPYLYPFMTSNDVPSGLGKAQIEHTLDVETKALTELDCRIADLRLQLDELVWQRERRQQRIRDCNFALKPIRRVPAEILSEIFLSFVTEVDVYLEHESSIDPKQTIWILPQVSRRWRTVALSLHRLWSTVRLLQSDFAGVLSDTSFMLATQLYRAGSSELSVSVFSQVQFTTRHPLLQMLLATAEKWKELVIIMPSNSLVSLSRHCPASFPNLTSLHVWPVDHKKDSPTANVLSALQSTFQFCPKLFAIRTYPFCLPSLGLPLNQVKQFGTSSPLSADLCIGALKFLPNLLEFVSNRYDEERAVDNLQQLRHEKLEKLTVFNRRGAPRPIYLFQYLQAPSLRTLDIRYLTGIEPLLTFLTNSGRRLTRLQLESDSLTDADCIKILDKVPSLRSLTLHCPLVYTAAFGAQLISTDRANEPMIVPSLTFLELVGELVVANSGVEVLKIVKLREARPGLCSWWWIPD